MGGRGASSQTSRNEPSRGVSGREISRMEMPGGGTASATSGEAFDSWHEKYVDSSEERYFEYSNVPAKQAKELRDAGLNSSTAFQLYLNDFGDYAKPEVVSEEDFSAMVRSQKLQRKVIYRGCNDDKKLSGREMHERFMKGDSYYTGNGVYGDGIYFGGKSTATYYAKEGGAYHSSSINGSGAIIRAVLKPDAKVVSYMKILDEYKKRYGHAADNAIISAYARSRGYDAIRTKHGSGDTYTNVLNRGALIISDGIIDV